MLTIARQGDGEDELDLGKHRRHLLLYMRRPELSLLCGSHCSITFKDVRNEYKLRACSIF